MALPKRHWGNAAQTPGFIPGAACGRDPASFERELIVTSPTSFDGSAAKNPDWYCKDCAKAARLALAKEQPVAVSFSSTVRRCTRCRSGAINPSDHGRTVGVDLDLCDVCYWRKRADSATWPKPRPISEARETEIFGYCPDIGWRRLSQIGRKWALTGAEHIADYDPTHFLPLPPEVM